MPNYTLTYLEELEAEAILLFVKSFQILKIQRYCFLEARTPSVLTPWLKKPFYPASIPFPLIHVDTGQFP